MQITVFGASGNVGQLVVDRLLAAEHDVVVFIHRHSPFEPNEKLKIIKSDVHNAAFVEAAVRGSDAVISTLGSWHTPTKDILSSATRFLVPAMKQEGVERIITLTGSAAWTPAEELAGDHAFSHKMFGLAARGVLEDAETHLRLLHDSGLNWTTVRSPVMKSGANDDYMLDAKAPGMFDRVTRSAVAKALVAQLNDVTYYNLAPHIHQA